MICFFKLSDRTVLLYQNYFISSRQGIMGNMHHSVNMVLITYLVMAMSAHECLTSKEKKATFSSKLHPLESSSDVQQDNTVIEGLLQNS